SNYALKDEIRTYWSARAETFDQSPGHGMRSDGEIRAWADLLKEQFEGHEVRDVLELASGTGQVTAVLLSMDLQVTAIDLCEPMIAKASSKHRDAIGRRVKFHLGDAENTMMPDSKFDAVVSRHLVWTLPDPEAAFQDWLRVLKPGGRVVVIDGDWVNAPKRLSARIARGLVNAMDRWNGSQPKYDADAHDSIISRVYFKEGLRADTLSRMLQAAGFIDVKQSSLGRIWDEQVKHLNFKDRLSLGYWYWHYFMMSAKKP
ncbi:MAG: methyltransferase domain-containing protein, partial [Beijerinckiaceae bacterium]|nr:methyltransferase domain-containing protein [Beijerinckiaceae bacterium]